MRIAVLGLVLIALGLIVLFVPLFQLFPASANLEVMSVSVGKAQCNTFLGKIAQAFVPDFVQSCESISFWYTLLIIIIAAGFLLVLADIILREMGKSRKKKRR
jgi:hypothetical protein